MAQFCCRSCFSHGALKGKFVPEAEENSEAEK